MRTKKILSLLLAVIMTMGLFGVTAAYAEDDAAEDIEIAIPGEFEAFALSDFADMAAIEAQAAAIEAQAKYSNWPNPVEVVKNTSLAGGWDAAVFTWEGFDASKTGTESNKDSYAEQKTVGKAKVVWKVYAYEKVKDANGNPTAEDNTAVPMNDLKIATNSVSAAALPFQIYTHYANGTEQLHIKQGTATYYGTLLIGMYVDCYTSGPAPSFGEHSMTPTPLKVVSTVTFPGEEVALGAGTHVAQPGAIIPIAINDMVPTYWMTVKLVDQSAFNKVIDDAEKVLKNDSRYKEVYVKKLRAALNAARFYLSADVQFVDIDGAKKALQDVIDEAPNNYKIFDSDWGPLKWFDDNLAGPIYKIMDVIDEIVRVVNIVVDVVNIITNLVSPLVKVVTSIFGMFAPLLSILKVIFSLIGLALPI